MYDVANGHFVKEDVPSALRACAPRLRAIHLSDTDQSVYKHAAVGLGTVDFGVFQAYSASIGFTRRPILEIIAPDADEADRAQRTQPLLPGRPTDAPVNDTTTDTTVMKIYGKCYIDGEWVAPASATKLRARQPGRPRRPFATVSLASVDDVDRAVKAARRAFPSFSNTSKAERIALLERIVELIEEREAEIDAAITEELGSPRSAKLHCRLASRRSSRRIATLRDYDFETHVGANLVRREPIGVCGLITAWNWPLAVASRPRLSMALAAGCTMVLKPSEFTPVSAILVTEVLHDAGVPKGVFNLVSAMARPSATRSRSIRTSISCRSPARRAPVCSSPRRPHPPSSACARSSAASPPTSSCPMPI